MDILNHDQVKKINKVSLAKKHNVSARYVSYILSGERSASTEKAKTILADGHRLIKVLEQ